MSTLEKIARAIAEADASEPAQAQVLWETNRPEFVSLARAALEAMLDYKGDETSSLDYETTQFRLAWQDDLRAILAGDG